MRKKSATVFVTGIPNKICTWSYQPPTANDVASLLVIMPEMYWCSWSRQCTAMELALYFTANTA